MCDVLCTTPATVRIGGEDIPADQVQDRFYRLDNGHLEYVFDCPRGNTTQVRNIRAYLLTALYNAPMPAALKNFEALNDQRKEVEPQYLKLKAEIKGRNRKNQLGRVAQQGQFMGHQRA